MGHRWPGGARGRHIGSPTFRTGVQSQADLSVWRCVTIKRLQVIVKEIVAKRCDYNGGEVRDLWLFEMAGAEDEPSRRRAFDHEATDRGRRA